MTSYTDKKAWYTEQVLDCQLTLYRLAITLLHNEQDAEDALQDTLLSGYEKLDTLKDPEKFRPWIMRILHNTVYDILRARKDAVELGAVDELPGEAPLLPHSDGIGLREAVDALPLHYRAVVILYYYEDMPVRQIGQITGVSENVVKTRLHRARRQLRRLLDE